MRSHRSLGVLLALTVLGTVVATGGVAASASPDPADVGRFSAPFVEPTINGKRAKQKCIPHKTYKGDPQPDKKWDCKPAAVTMGVLPNGRVIYFNGIEGSENVANGITPELGHVSANDLTRVLDVRRRTWRVPTPEDGGANPKGYDYEPLVPGATTTETYNDGGVFCADVNFLPDGRLLTVGGTAFYNDPGADGVPYGIVELEGLRNARIYDAKTNTWTQSGSMKYGRWYPTLVTLGDGRMLVASGVQKLLKPLYPTHPQDSGRNVIQTETYDPKTGKWTYNGASADRSLPLFARLHLLPNGHVFFNSAGQVFNPFGQAYDEFMWNYTASYDPKRKTWTTLGIPGMGSLAPGFRGSSFSIMLPLDPRDGYRQARFLSAGGILGTTPGTYVANALSAITTVDTRKADAIVTQATGSLNFARWYSTGVALPTGEVAIFNGANRDEVIGPGTGIPMNTTELFDPKSNTWRTVASSRQGRTYHNTAALLPDGRVLVGGHAPITTLYGNHTTIPAGGFSPNDGRDPTFEIFSPPYLFRGPRPRITATSGSLGYGGRLTISTSAPSSKIASVVLVRNTSITHLVDGDQRVVELKVVGRKGNDVVVAMPPNGNVAPPGPYMLFANAKTPKGPTPSVAKQVFLR